MLFSKQVLLRSGFFIWIGFVLIVFNKFAFEIDEFNASVRLFLRHGDYNLRYFDQNGIPRSKLSNFEKEFISPFYVVHYGIIYSSVEKSKHQDKLHWDLDKTARFWDLPPENISKDYFLRSAQWIIEHLNNFNGKYHLLYEFDWPYKGYPNGGLKSPWYSGLTDAYAILLMLRAYDATNDDSYLKAANNLYESVTAEVRNSGSLTYLGGNPWIEEYVDPRLNDRQNFAYVLNGMIYATYGVIAYENYLNKKDGYTNELLGSIAKNLPKFNMQGWSSYDLIGTKANLKYHRIHVGLLEELKRFYKKDTKDFMTINEFHDVWQKSNLIPCFFWIKLLESSVGYIHFILTLFTAFLLYPFSYCLYKKYK